MVRRDGVEYAAGRHQIGAEVWGPEQTGSLVGEEGLKRGGILPNPEELQGAGISGRLDYSITLGPEESKTISFAIAGGARGYAFAREKATDLLVRNAELWREKAARQERVLEGASRIETPVASIPQGLESQDRSGSPSAWCVHAQLQKPIAIQNKSS